MDRLTHFFYEDHEAMKTCGDPLALALSQALVTITPIREQSLSLFFVSMHPHCWGACESLQERQADDNFDVFSPP